MTGGAADLTPSNPLYEMERTMGVAQHHDAVAGTEKQAVAYDYAQRIALGRADADVLISQALGNLTGYAAGKCQQHTAVVWCICVIPDGCRSLCWVRLNKRYHLPTFGSGRADSRRNLQPARASQVRYPGAIVCGATGRRELVDCVGFQRKIHRCSDYRGICRRHALAHRVLQLQLHCQCRMAKFLCFSPCYGILRVFLGTSRTGKGRPVDACFYAHHDGDWRRPARPNNFQRRGHSYRFWYYGPHIQLRKREDRCQRPTCPRLRVLPIQ
jgi:hypothetical protein